MPMPRAAIAMDVTQQEKDAGRALAIAEALRKVGYCATLYEPILQEIAYLLEDYLFLVTKHREPNPEHVAFLAEGARSMLRLVGLEGKGG